MESIRKFIRKIFCCNSESNVELISKDENLNQNTIVYKSKEENLNQNAVFCKKEITKQIIQKPTECFTGQSICIDSSLEALKIENFNYYCVKSIHNLPMATNVQNTDYFYYDLIPEYLFTNQKLSDTFAALPEQKERKSTLVLDLDNTLVYPSTKEIQDYDFKVEIIGVKNIFVYFIKRPGLDEFLIELKKYYEIVIFTAGIMAYGLKATKKIDSSKSIDYILSRKHCVGISRYGEKIEGYTKNLKILGRDLKQTIIVDDRPHSYALNILNGQHIPSFDGNKSDIALFELKEYLLSILSCEDFRYREPLVYSVPNKITNIQSSIVNLDSLEIKNENIINKKF